MSPFLLNSLPTDLLINLNELDLDHKEQKNKLVSIPDSLYLEIISPAFFEIEELSKIFYLLYNKLFYLFNYLDYRIKFSNLPKIEKNLLHNYFIFLYFNPFL